MIIEQPLAFNDQRQSKIIHSMNREEINDWLQVLGLIAVAISLVFVGLELKQSRDIARADVYQQRAASAIQMITDSYSNQAFVSGAAKLKRGEKLTEYENAQILSHIYRALNHFENLHFQYEMGLLTQEQWDATRNELRRFTQLDAFLSAWKDGEDTWRPSYTDLINELIDQSNSYRKQKND